MKSELNMLIIFLVEPRCDCQPGPVGRKYKLFYSQFITIAIKYSCMSVCSSVLVSVCLSVCL